MLPFRVMTPAPAVAAALVGAVLLLSSGAAHAQTPGQPPPVAPAQAATEPCANFEPDKTRLPAAGSSAIMRCLQIVFHPVNESIVDPETYAFYIKHPFSVRSEGRFVPYDEEALLADFQSLWRTGFIDDLWIEVVDEPYENDVVGKHVIFHLEERSRIKQVDYVSTGRDTKLRVEVSKIEETLRERSIAVRLDSFVDDATLRRVTGVIRELHSDLGYHDVKVDTATRALPGGAKLVHLTFNINAGPKFQIGAVEFDGNQALSDGKLRRRLKENRPKGWLSFITSAGTYHSSKWADDAQAIEDYYRDRGHARARVGEPRVEVIRDSADGKTRLIRLRVPVDEGPKYTVGAFTVEGNGPIREDYLKSVFKLVPGETYSRKRIAKGIEKAQEAFGSFGFYQMQPDPILDFKDFDEEKGVALEGQPTVLDINMKFVPGEQFVVNRITFTGNTTTHDSVIRRELRIAEGGVFNTLALRESLRRLNQLGYFQPLDDAGIKINTVPNTTNKVDVGVTFEEQNRNQISFGAGVSQFDGFFGQLGYQTSNFLGRGETLGINLQRGSQARNYQVSFSEPYLFERPITVGADVYLRQFIFPLQYTQESIGTNFVVGFPLASFTRAFAGYSYEEVKVQDINELYLLPEVRESNPFLADSLLLNSGGRRTVSKISPSVVMNTVDHPIFPRSGRKITAGLDIAGLGGNTSFVQSRFEGIFYVPMGTRYALGVRGEGQYIRPYGSTTTLPIFERFFLGGEYSIRGFDIRTVGPRDNSGRIVLGGNKSLLFNAEFYVSVAGPVRLLAFYDAGQVRDLGERFGWWEDVTRTVPAPLPVLYDPTNPGSIRDPNVPIPLPTIEVLGRRNAFRTSTGLELRFFMPVLNVPFRLIAAYNPQRGGILNNNLLLQPKFTFRFAVGTTF